MNEFSKAVIKMIRAIPEGKVATYGQIAKLAGKPQGSRAVAWILHSSSTTHDLPWQRVLSSQGKISFPVGSGSFLRQRKLLRADGVEISPAGKIDLAEFQWKRQGKAKRHRPQMFQS